MTEQKMTVQKMLPHLETLFKAKAMRRVIIYVYDDDFDIQRVKENDGLLAAYSYEPLKLTGDLVQDMTRVFESCLSCTMHTMLKSPLNNGAVAAFVKPSDDCDFKAPNIVGEFLNLPPSDIWTMMFKSGTLYNQLNPETKIDGSLVSFFIDDYEEPRVTAMVQLNSGETEDVERERFSNTITQAIPELSDDTHRLTYFGMKLEDNDELHVRYGFDHATGKHLPTDDTMMEDVDFIMNFVAANSDGSEFAPDSKLFVKPEDWENLIPIPEQ